MKSARTERASVVQWCSQVSQRLVSAWARHAPRVGMEAVLRAFEEYSAQLAEVQEGLRLDPENSALKELLLEIASNIERTEAELASGIHNAGAVVGGDVVEEDDFDLYGEDDEAAEEEKEEEDSSSDEEAATARPSDEEPHSSRASIALLAQGWQPQSEAEEPLPEASGHWRVTVPAAAAAAGAFGEWERFTRGVGSRLLARMGYRRGRGLGARGDGTVEPLGAGTAPRGTHGLGYERRPKRRRGGKRGREARQAAGEAARKSRRRGEEAPAASTFDFLNRTLNRCALAPGCSGTDCGAELLRRQHRALRAAAVRVPHCTCSLRASCGSA